MSKVSGCCGMSNTGKVRSENEDRFLIGHWTDDNVVLTVVADGMGSYGGGSEAAEIVMQTFSELLDQQLPSMWDERYELLLGAFYIADERIRTAQTISFPEMGATVVAALITSDTLLHLHAGDCRLLHISNGALSYVTRDHSVVQALKDSGRINDEEALSHPLRNVVTSCVGGPESGLRLIVDPIFPLPESIGDDENSPLRILAAGDTVVLCSDGLWSAIGSEYISAVVGNQEALEMQSDSLAERLVCSALKTEAHDNITAVAFDVTAFRSATVLPLAMVSP